MSRLEERIENELRERGIAFERQKPVPINDYPWKTSRSKTSPKCDFYPPKIDLYVEVKGFMTYMAVSKLSFLSRQHYRYYIFQGTESQWSPTIDSFLKPSASPPQSERGLLEFNFNHQIAELAGLNSHSDFLENISEVSLKRLKSYVNVKIEEYKSWNGEWY